MANASPWTYSPRASDARPRGPVRRASRARATYIMRRTQLLLPESLHREATRIARERNVSLGAFVREALADYVAETARTGGPGGDPLLDAPFDDPRPDARLALDHDHHLYGAPRVGSRVKKARARRR